MHAEALTSTVTIFRGSANGHLEKLASPPAPLLMAADCTVDGLSKAVATVLATLSSSFRAALNALATKGSSLGPGFQWEAMGENDTDADEATLLVTH